MGAISAAVTATTVTQYFFGMQPVFHMGVVPVIDTGDMYFLLILLGAFVGLLGLAFNPMLTRSQDFYEEGACALAVGRAAYGVPGLCRRRSSAAQPLA